MAEELQGLIERINRDGVEKANAKAAEIVASAESRAADIVRKAQDAADRSAAAARESAEQSAERARETIRQAARDAIISVERSVTRILERLLAEDVDSALADPAVATAVAGEAVKGLAGDAEVFAGAKVAEALRAQLAARGGFRVTLDDSVGSGFTVRLDGGRVEHDFTGAAIAAELSKRLRPDLAKIVGEA